MRCQLRCPPATIVFGAAVAQRSRYRIMAGFFLTGCEIQTGGVTAQRSSSSLDHGLKWNSSRILDPSREPGQGRPRATTAGEDRHLSIIVRRNRGATASRLSRYLYAATGTRVSRVTVSKRLHERGLFA
ncbi:HTH_Tnp_Tc3_2 domain-containing protein [Trichonephila clavipes]|nr:HTH_Tnp_Tc3_2 domain-containing protein [Trichonephila clavipes]